MSKKILSVMLALVFVVSAFAVSAFAVGGTAVDPEAATKTQAWALSDPTGDGPYSVDVTLDANYKVGAIQFKVDGADAVLTDVALNADVFGADWEDNYDVDFTDDGLVIIIPTPGSAAKQGPDLTGGKKIVTLTYELAEGKTSAKIAIKNDPKAEGNIGGSLIAVRMSDDSLTTGTLYYGQTVTSVGTEKTLGSAAAEPADLVATATGATAGVVVDANKFASANYDGVVYGIPLLDAGATKVVDANYKTYYATYLTASNGGSLEFTKTPYVARPNSYGTGTVITVKNADGTVSKTYVVVLFGDTTGDGAIDKNDVSAINNAVNGTALKSDIVLMAANVAISNRGNDATKAAYLYNLDKNDVSNVNNDLNNRGSKVLSADLAAAHNTYNYYYQ